MSKVQTKYKIIIREDTALGWRKNFMEKMASYAGIRVRRILMPKLLKKIKATEGNGQKRKRSNKVKGFDAALHVKKERHDKDMLLEQVDTNGTINSDLEMSSITEVSIRDTATYQAQVEKITKEMYLKLEEEFSDNKDIMIRIKAKLEYQGDGGCEGEKEKEKETVVDLVETEKVSETKETETTTSTDMFDEGASMDWKEPQDFTKTNYVRFGRNIIPNIFTTPDKIWDNVKCKEGCNMECKWVDSKKETLEQIFGEELGCVKCNKGIFECMTKGTNKGAYICVHCKDKKCRQMYCNVCYVQHGNVKRSSRRRTKQT